MSLEILLFGRDAKGVQHEPDIISEAIRIYTRSHYSHSAIRVDGDQVPAARIYECGAEGCAQIVGAQAVIYGQTAVAHCVIAATEEQVSAGESWARSVIGDRYNYLGLFAFAVGLHVEMPHEQICSSFVALFLDHAGVWASDEPMSETPATLAARWGAQPL